MTRADLIERAAFWQAGLMDIDHLRDVAYEAMDSEFDGDEFRLIAGDAKLDTFGARDLLSRALRAAGMALPSVGEAERIVAASVARSVLAGAVEPIWGANLIGQFGGDIGHSDVELPTEVWGPLVYDSCDCCNGLDGMVGAEKRGLRRKETREDIRRHIVHVLPRIEEWAGLRPSPDGGPPPAPGFLGWRRPFHQGSTSSNDLDRLIRWVLLRFWDPLDLVEHPQERDVYDDFIPHVRTLLTTVAADADLAQELERYLRRAEDSLKESIEGRTAPLRRETTVQELLHLRYSW